MKIEMVDINTVKPYENNPRKNDSAVDKVVESLKEFGFQQPIVVDAENVVIVGHTRLKAAKKLKLGQVPVVRAENLSPQQAKAYRLADNRTNEFADWDYSLLANEFSDLTMLGYDLKYTGFTPSELDNIKTIEVVEDGFNVDEALKNQTIPRTKVGDVWQLGAHKVMCGDATNLDDVDRLMDEHTADMIFTDPPYNATYKSKRTKRDGIKNDSMPDEEFYTFLYDAFLNMFVHTKAGGGIYVFHADSESLNFRNALKDSGWGIKQCLVWVKNSTVIGRHNYNWQHEPILFGWKPGENHKWYGGRNKSTVIKPEDGITINKLDSKTSQITIIQGLKRLVFNITGKYDILDLTDSTGSSVWDADKPLKSGEHPTMKPLKLCEKGIRNSSLEGDLVLDLFGGSGSTLLTCEQLGRTCYMLELDPVYVDITVDRWEKFTKLKAVRVGD